VGEVEQCILGAGKHTRSLAGHQGQPIYLFSAAALSAATNELNCWGSCLCINFPMPGNTGLVLFLLIIIIWISRSSQLAAETNLPLLAWFSYFRGSISLSIIHPRRNLTVI